MTPPTPPAFDIDTMPRGGPHASWLDRRLQTDRLEYTDRDDVPDARKQLILGYLDRSGDRSGERERVARLVLDQVARIENPRILELGAGHGKLSTRILELHPRAHVTATDLDPKLVACMVASPLGSHPRATTKVADATHINDPDHSYDLVVFTMAFHHLPPAAAHRAIADATRVGTKFLVVDLKRPPPLGLLLAFLLVVVFAIVIALDSSLSAVPSILHDSYISLLRSYNKAALHALGTAADPTMSIEFLEGKGNHVVLYSRP